jgi:tRNA pseudouridine55 synthase
LIDGVLLLDKPAGITSFRALGTLKQRLGTGRVGHTGTLDRFASGLLVAVAGRLTRLASLVESLPKEYVAVVTFGTGTDTLDPEGAVTATGPVPSRDELEAALPAFRGEIAQVPPAYSAVHVAGRRAHHIARSGGVVDLAARRVTVHSLELAAWNPPEAIIEVVCSRGTYIRSLARDIADALGTCGHLSRLRRTRLGGLRVEDARAPADVDPARDFLTARRLFDRCPGLRSLAVRPEAGAMLVRGVLPEDRWFVEPPGSDGLFGAFSAGDRLLAIVEHLSGCWRCAAVFPPGGVA